MRDLINALGGVARRIRNDAPVPFSSQGRMSMFQESGNGPLGDRAYAAYGSVGTLFAIVSQIAQSVAATDWHMYRKGPKRDKQRRTEVTSHGFLDVWALPNPFNTGFMFRESAQQHLDLVGEGVIVLNTIGSLVIEMWVVRPDRMKPVKDPKKYLVGWIYTGPDGEEVPLELNQVVQIKYPNPADPYRGMGPVQTVLHDIDAAKYSAEWNKNFFINGARPGGIIKIDYRMSDDEFNAFLARWRQQHQGIANAHRVGVLENAEWVDTNFTMADMQFVELREMSREIIREAFAYPKPMLGTVDDVNRANADAGKEIKAENQIDPRLARWKDTVNAFLLPRFANGKALEMDYDDPVPINREAADHERDSQANSAAKLATAGWHPDDVTDAVGLPRMRWVGPPTAQSGNADQTASDGSTTQPANA
jgi:HK97 family phage portal protein